MTAARRQATTGGKVLPRAGSKAGSRTIRTVDQLLTKKQRSNLRQDLVEMARRRREAEASSGTLRLS